MINVAPTPTACRDSGWLLSAPLPVSSVAPPLCINTQWHAGLGAGGVSGAVGSREDQDGGARPRSCPIQRLLALLDDAIASGFADQPTATRLKRAVSAGLLSSREIAEHTMSLLLGESDQINVCFIVAAGDALGRADTRRGSRTS